MKKLPLLSLFAFGLSYAFAQNSHNPKARFVATGLCTNATTQFYDSSKVDSGNIVSRLWDFGDSTLSTKQNPAHAYTKSATYLVTLIVTSDSGYKDTFSSNIIIETLKASFTAKAFLCGNDIDTFYNTSTPDSGLTYVWDFGDGTIDSAKNPKHKFKVEYDKTFKVILNISKLDGCIAIYTQNVVCSMPDAGLKYYSYQASDIPVFLKPIDDNCISYLWIFNGKDSIRKKNPILFWDSIKMGKNKFTLIVTNQYGCTNRIDSSFMVYPDGIKETKEALQLYISPNPIQEEAIVSLVGLKNGNYAYHLFDYTGKSIRNGKVDSRKGNFIIRRENLLSGVYWLRLEDENGRVGMATVVME